MDNNESREELKRKIADIDKLLDEIKADAEATGTPISMPELTRLEDEKDELLARLEEIEEEVEPEQPEIEPENGGEIEPEEVPRVEEEIEQEEPKVDHETEEEIEQEEPKNDDQSRDTLLGWQLKTGIYIVGEDYVKNKLDSDHITEEEFKKALSDGEVVKIIKAPRLAEDYLRSADDWDGVRTSMTAVDQAIKNGTLSQDKVNNESYVLLQYDNEKVKDKDTNKEEPGYGVMDEGDFYGEKEDNEMEKIDDPEKEAELREGIDEDSILNRVNIYMKNGMYMLATKEIYEALEASKALNMMSQVNISPMLESVAGMCAGGAAAFQKEENSLEHDVNNPNPDLSEQGQEKENDDDEIPFGSTPKMPY